MTDERIYDRERMMQSSVFPTKQTPSYADWALFEMGSELEDAIGGLGDGEWEVVRPEDYPSLLDNNTTLNRDILYVFTRAVQDEYPDGTVNLDTLSSRLYLPKGYSRSANSTIYTGLNYTVSYVSRNNDSEVVGKAIRSEKVFIRWRGAFTDSGTLTYPRYTRVIFYDDGGVITVSNTLGSSTDTVPWTNLTDPNASISQEGYYRIIFARK